MVLNMIAAQYLIYGLLLNCVLKIEVHAQDPSDLPGQPPLQKYSFQAPEHTEEQAESGFMPEGMACDGCQVVAYKMFEAFQLYNSKHKHYKNQLPESDVISILDELCIEKAHSTFENYGMKEVNGKAVLCGPGLASKDQPGVIAGGGKWPSRLAKMCEFFRGELDDYPIYNAYKANPKSRLGLTNFMCYGEGIQGSCNASGDKKGRSEL